MKGRKVTDIEVQSQRQKYGTDQDTSLSVETRLTKTGQWVVDIHSASGTMTLSTRSAIDLAHKLSKLALDHVTDLMLLFMKEKPDE